MTGLDPVAWRPARTKTERLVLREPEARDRAAFIELLASPETHTYLGPELGYLLLPEAWGRGYGAEACAAALGWFADAFPGKPVVFRRVVLGHAVVTPSA
jgi:RimJ/RimL family protein N-acetyltransferase